ncbi:prolipoprotein diacylglyceryl transferase [Candidatus Dependentiae bacterium]|nr:prolipoprotein diacylglyceryl transferase [Candidatus Dependentiae bacterium]
MCPRLFTIYGPIAIQSYGFMIVVGLLTFLAITYYHPRRAKILSGEMYLNAVFMGLLVGVLGGRFLGVIADWQTFKQNPIEIFFPWVGGFVVLGAIMGIVMIMPLYLWWHRIDVLKLFDFVAVYAPLMQAIARFGCLFAGCCYGIAANPNAWYAITFTSFEAHMPESLLGIPLIPTQLFAGGASAVIFLLMLLLQGRFARVGQAAFFYLMCENIARFSVDFWRGDRGDLYSLLGLHVSQFQLYSLLFFTVCFGLFFYITLFGRRVTND